MNDDEARDDDVSAGKIADDPSLLNNIFSQRIQDRFEVFSYRNAAAILSRNYPAQFSVICKALEQHAIPRSMIRMPGGSKGPIAHYVDTLFPFNWIEARITADLHVRLYAAKKANAILHHYVRKGFLGGHRIDFVNDRVALDLEWNSKDQTYDRDLAAFSAFYEAGAIDVGVLITRGTSLDNKFLRSLGKVLNKDGSVGQEMVYRKFGASTTWMGKLLYRLDAGRNGGCPVLALGITPKCVVEG